MSRPRSALSATLVLALPAMLLSCGLILDLPDPRLVDAIGGDPLGTEDGAAGEDATLPDGNGNGEGSLDARPACDADLMTDLQHCGACHHDCTGGTCAGGICTLVGDDVVKGAAEIATSGDDVVFTVSGFTAGVYKCPKSGCTTGGPTLLTTDLDAGTIQPKAIAVGPAHVYWSHYRDTGGIYRTSLDGGDTTRMSPGEDFPWITSVLVSNAGIAWTHDFENAAVAFCPLPCTASGAATRLPTVPGNPNNGVSQRIVAGPGTSLIWSESNWIARCDSPECTDVEILATDVGAVYGLAVDDTHVYVGDFFDNQIVRCALTGCNQMTSLVVDNQTEGVITAIAVRDGRLYWTMSGTQPVGDGPTTDGVVRRCDLTDCPGTVVDIATGEASPEGLAVDDTSIYWVNFGHTDKLDYPSTIRKAPR